MGQNWLETCLKAVQNSLKCSKKTLLSCECIISHFWRLFWIFLIYLKQLFMVIILPDMKNVLRFWNDGISRSDISEPQFIICWRSFLPKCKSKVSRIRFKVVRSAADMHAYNWNIFYRKFPSSVVGIIICRLRAVISTFGTILFTNGRFWTPTYYWKVKMKSNLEKSFILR